MPCNHFLGPIVQWCNRHEFGEPATTTQTSFPSSETTQWTRLLWRAAVWLQPKLPREYIIKSSNFIWSNRLNHSGRALHKRRNKLNLLYNAGVKILKNKKNVYKRTRKKNDEWENVSVLLIPSASSHMPNQPEHFGDCVDFGRFSQLSWFHLLRFHCTYWLTELTLQLLDFFLEGGSFMLGILLVVRICLKQSLRLAKSSFSLPT